jgi:hypothetical protein
MLRSIYRPIALLLISLFPFAAMAEILEVYDWKANPGMGQQMFETMAGAKRIHETLGVRVDVYGLQVGSDGSVHYVMRFDSMADWGSKKDAIASSAEWMEFYAEAGKTAASELQSSLIGINSMSQSKQVALMICRYSMLLSGIPRQARLAFWFLAWPKQSSSMKVSVHALISMLKG